MTTRPNAQPEAEQTFTHCFQSLEGILEQFKTGSLSLEESLGLFEQGVGHLKVCQEKLSKAKGRVDELVKSLEDGGAVMTKPFEEADG